MPSIIRSYKDLEVWQRSVGLAVDLYSVTRRFPTFERYAISSQIQRAGVSIPSNIAEGNGKSGPGHYLSHLSHSRGSLCELETLRTIAARVGYLETETEVALAERTSEIGRMLNGLTDAIARSAKRGTSRHT